MPGPSIYSSFSPNEIARGQFDSPTGPEYVDGATASYMGATGQGTPGQRYNVQTKQWEVPQDRNQQTYQMKQAGGLTGLMQTLQAQQAPGNAAVRSNGGAFQNGMDFMDYNSGRNDSSSGGGNITVDPLELYSGFEGHPGGPVYGSPDNPIPMPKGGMNQGQGTGPIDPITGRPMFRTDNPGNPGGGLGSLSQMDPNQFRGMLQQLMSTFGGNRLSQTGGMDPNMAMQTKPYQMDQPAGSGIQDQNMPYIPPYKAPPQAAPYATTPYPANPQSQAMGNSPGMRSPYSLRGTFNRQG